MQSLKLGGATRVAGRRWRLALAGASMSLLVVASGCFRSKTDEPVEPVAPTYVRVVNQAFLDMTVYVYRSSQRVRLGQANGNSVTRLRVPQSLLFGATPLRFQADPIGGSRQSISQEITVDPGDEVTLTIPPS